jgi:LmbE family N-acetylglucosaminyl deacetylase
MRAVSGPGDLEWRHAAISDLGTILGVWAHPDDETYLTAGIMSAAVERGKRVVCVTATRGEAGSLDHERYPPEKMGEVREAELASSLRVLGVREHHWLDYIDGACHEVDFDEATKKVQTIIEDVRPDSVLTFGPDGLTGHLDHIAVSNWTTEAFARGAPSGSRLYYAATERTWFEEFGSTLVENNVYGSGTPDIKNRDEIAIYFDTAGPRLDQKLAAIRAQVSQVDWLIAAVGEEFYRKGLALETFVMAAEK